MPHEQMDEKQVAAYLHMDPREVRKLASRGQMPCRRVRDGFLFRKGELDHWVETQMHRLPRETLSRIEKGVTAHHGFGTHEALLIAPMIPPGGLVVPLEARTRDAVLRAMVALADSTGVVYGKDDLLKHVRAREELCSTAIVPGVALPHPRSPLPYDIERSFVVAGLTPSGVPFGAADGSLTRLFFLICCKDESTHLHVLARLAQILHDPGVIDDLMDSSSGDDLRRKLLLRENDLLQRQR